MWCGRVVAVNVLIAATDILMLSAHACGAVGRWPEFLTAVAVLAARDADDYRGYGHGRPQIPADCGTLARKLAVG